MDKTDYRTLMDKPYLGAWDIPEGGELTLEIDRCGTDKVMNESHKEDEKLLIYFKDAKKPMICNVTNAKAISKVAGSTYIEDWQGVRIILYTSEVSAFGETRDAIRVRPYAPKLSDAEIKCAECGKTITDHGKYKAKAIAESSKGTYGKPLCWDCANKAKEEAEAKAKESDVL